MRATDRHHRPSALLHFVLAALLWNPAVAFASGLSLPGIGTNASGVTRTDAAATWFNPGQLGFIQEGELLMGAGLVLGSVGYQRERLGAYQFEDSFDFALPIAEEDIDRSKTGRADEVSASPLGVSGDFFIAVPISDRVTAGFGLYAPYGAILDLPDDGAQRFTLREATIFALYATPSIGVRLSDRVSLGGGVSYVAGIAEISRVQDFAELTDVGDALEADPIDQQNDFGPDAPTGVRELDVMARPIVFDGGFASGVAFNFGVAAQVGDGTRLGATFQSGTRLNFAGDVTIDMNDDFFTQDLASQGLQYDPLVEGDGTLSFSLPWIARLGIGQDVSDQFAVDFMVSLVGWSAVDSFDIRVESSQLAQPELGIPPTAQVGLERDWVNTVEAELLPLWQPSEKLTLWSRLGYHSPASPDRTMDLAAIDGHRIIAGLGGELEVSERLGLVADGTLHTIIPREVVSSDYDRGNGSYRLTLARLGGAIRLHF